MKITKQLLRLASNPNTLGVNYLKTIANKSNDSRKSLEYVLGEDIITSIIGVEVPNSLENIGYVYSDSISKDVNTIFVWGQPKSGKTSFVASLLASAREIEYYGEPKLVEKSRQMADMFSETGGRLKIINPGESKCVDVALAEISQRVGFFKKCYPEMFVEIQMPNDVSSIDTLANNYLKAAREQIHIFCIDCSVESVEIDVQAKMVTQMLDYLNKIGSIARTNGVYIAVTKSDMMYRVPRMYREQAAQTLITAGQRELWQRVCNICYDKGIYGATPLVYSIGDVKFQQMVSIDLTAARKVLVNPILQKSQPRLTWFIRMLRMFNEKVTASVFCLVLFLAACGIYSLISVDGIVPKGKNVPYDYKMEFINRVMNEINGETYSNSHKVYDELLADLNYEKTIKISNGDFLLGNGVVFNCDSVLKNTFAPIVHNAVTKEIENSQWNDELLADCKNYCKSLEKSGIVGDSIIADLTHDYEIIYEYFNAVKPFVYKSKNCSSLEEVKEIVNNINIYDKLPYTNNYTIREGLDNAVDNALISYAQSLKSLAISYKQNYESVERGLYSIPFYSIFSSNEKSLEYEKEILESKASILNDRLDELSNYASNIDNSVANITINEAIEIIEYILW